MPKAHQEAAAHWNNKAPKYATFRLVPTLVATMGVLLAGMSVQTILFAGQIEANVSLYVALYISALVAFGASAFLVMKILQSVSVAADHLSNLAKPAAAVAEAEDAIPSVAARPDPLDRLLAASRAIAIRIETSANEIERLKEIDPVTGLGNRWWLQWRARQEFARAEREKSPISMVIVKIDRLDDINAEFGHHAGNTALLSVADTLRDFVRPYDLIGRIAGEAFGIVLPGADRTSAAHIAERLQRAIANRTLALLGDRNISASLSVVERDASDALFEQFFERGHVELRTKT